jgi:hypothetical protein
MREKILTPELIDQSKRVQKTSTRKALFQYAATGIFFVLIGIVIFNM